MEATDGQQSFNLPRDISRGEQLTMLRTAKLPNRPGVAGGTLKAVLKGIDDFGRRCWAGFEKLAEASGKSERQTKRAVKQLEALNLLCVERRAVPGRRGTRNEYVIVWGELARFARSKAAKVSSATVALDSAERSATVSPNKCHPVQERSATVSHSYPCHPTRRNENEAPSDVDEAGARYFFTDEEEEIRRLANKIDKHTKCRTLEDRELVLKVATLWHDRKLDDEALGQVLESYDLKAKAGDPIRNRPAWFWSTLKGQCEKQGVKFEQLLAGTDFPRELLERQQPVGTGAAPS